MGMIFYLFRARNGCAWHRDSVRYFLYSIPVAPSMNRIRPYIKQKQANVKSTRHLIVVSSRLGFYKLPVSGQFDMVAALVDGAACSGRYSGGSALLRVKRSSPYSFPPESGI